MTEVKASSEANGVEVEKKDATTKPSDEKKKAHNTTESIVTRLQLLLCARNPTVANWAEVQLTKNNGFICKIHEFDKLAEDDISHKYKCQFRIGYDKDKKLACGFATSDHDPKILTIEPGDDKKNVPEIMKVCVQKFNEFFKGQTTTPWNKKNNTGHWDHILMKLSPEEKLMVVIFFHPNGLTNDQVNKIKKDLKDFFVDGGGKDAQVMSLWFQGREINKKNISNDQDMLELLHGAPSFTQEFGGKTFVIGPHFVFQFNHGVLERVNNAIINFLDVTSQTNLIDVNSASGCITVTLADKCKKVFALQRVPSSDINETLQLNKISNIEMYQGKAEEALAKIFEAIKDEDDVKVVLCPPRGGVHLNVIKELRSHEKIKKIVYIISSVKMTLKNFLDFSYSSDKLDFKGLPFLPTEIMSIGVDPSTSRISVVLLERVDISTFPKAKNAPLPLFKRPNNRSRRVSKRRLPQSGSGPSPKRAQRGGQPSGRGMPSRQVGRGPQSRPIGGRGPPPRPIGRGPRPRLMGREPLPSLMSRGPPIQPWASNAVNSFPVETRRIIQGYEQRLAELEEREKAFEAGLQLALAFQNRPEPREHLATTFDNRARNTNDRSLPLLLDNASRSVPSMSSRERSFFNSSDNANTSDRNLPSLLGNTRPFSSRLDRERNFDNREQNFDNRERNFRSHDNFYMDYSDNNDRNRSASVNFANPFSSNSNNHTRDTSDLVRGTDREQNTNYGNDLPSLLDIHEQDFPPNRVSRDIVPASIMSRRERTSTGFEDFDQSFSANFNFSDRSLPPLYENRTSDLGNYQGTQNRGFSNRNFGRGGGNQQKSKSKFRRF